MLVGVYLDPRQSTTTSKSAEYMVQTVKKSKGVVWKIFPKGSPKGTQTYPRASLKPPRKSWLLQGICRGQSQESKKKLNKLKKTQQTQQKCKNGQTQKGENWSNAKCKNWSNAKCKKSKNAKM